MRRGLRGKNGSTYARGPASPFVGVRPYAEWSRWRFVVISLFFQSDFGDLQESFFGIRTIDCDDDVKRSQL